MKFGQLIDMINTYQKLEKLLDEKSQSRGYYNNEYKIRLEEEIKELIKKIEDLREEEV